jgi:hypothetical protein
MLRRAVKELDEYAQQQEHKCRTAATLLQPMFEQYSVAKPQRRRRASTIAAAARSEDELTVLHGGALHGLSETDLLELSHHPFNNEVSCILCLLLCYPSLLLSSIVRCAVLDSMRYCT